MKWLLVLLAATCLQAQSSLSRRAPGFSLPDSRLKQYDLADYRGKVLLIEFMRTNCNICQSLTTVLEEVKKKYGGKIAILNVVAPPDNQDTVGRYIQQLNVTSPILFDCGQMTASYLRITPDKPTVHYPHLVFVDENGFIRREMSADLNSTELNSGSISRSIESLLGDKK